MAKATSTKATSDSSETEPSTPKTARVSQSVLPSVSIMQALKVARAIWNELAGDGGKPLEVAAALDVQPTGGAWRSITGAANAYGFTEGGYNAARIKLLPLGRRCVAPEEEGDDARGLVEAFLKPTLIKAFLEKYDGRKLPSEQIGANVIAGLGYPKERAGTAFALISSDAEKLGLIKKIKNELYVNLDARPSSSLSGKAEADEGEDVDPEEEQQTDRSNVFALLAGKEPAPASTDESVTRVFITHGKDAGIRNQIEELIKFGSFEPVVSVKTESLAKPVPMKVLDEMRSCQAAVIHVNVEQKMLDQNGEQVDLVNQNVLIEIGAAMALYREKFILLVEDGVQLPSNLQGLYECRYSGSELSMTAAMKLLKAFNEFKGK